MDILLSFVDFVVHIDAHLDALIQSYHAWAYVVLFLIVFLETGFVAAPFLPGDSLLFAAGTFAGFGSLNIVIVFMLLSAAAILGDSVNYWIGYHSSSRLFKKEAKWLNESYLERTQKFYEVHGKKTIIIARFVPIIRTFAPFVAGIAKMNYRQFLSYNIVGGILWVFIFTFVGYFFGNIPIVRENFSVAVLGIIIISFIPAVVEFWRHRAKN
ncbi:MAG: membrane-associated protein [Parcubacteria group bacterium Gr01-1014_44]|nr:MAG: membrane-associated protein [Parcubacteria group bacterium Gr01-1014_44]